MGKYGLDVSEIFANAPTFEEEVGALPTKLQGAPNFLAVLGIEHSRMIDLYRVASDIYALSDLENCEGANLDMYGSDYGLLRGKYGDKDFRSFIKLWVNFSRANSGTIPDIRESVRLAFPDDHKAIDVADHLDGTVGVMIPSTASSEVFSAVAANVTAAGIELVITLASSFYLGVEFNQTREIVRDRDDRVMKAYTGYVLTSGKRCKRYGSRIEFGMEGI